MEGSESCGKTRKAAERHDVRQDGRGWWMMGEVQDGRLGSLFNSGLVRFAQVCSGLVRFGQGAPLLKLRKADKVGRQSAGDYGGIPTPPSPGRHSVTKPGIIDRY